MIGFHDWGWNYSIQLKRCPDTDTVNSLEHKSYKCKLYRTLCCQGWYMGDQKLWTRTSVFPVQSMLIQDLGRFGLWYRSWGYRPPLPNQEQHGHTSIVRKDRPLWSKGTTNGGHRGCHDSTIPAAQEGETGVRVYARPSSKKWCPSKLWAISSSHTMEEDSVAEGIICMLTLNPLRQVWCCFLLLIISCST